MWLVLCAVGPSTHGCLVCCRWLLSVVATTRQRGLALSACMRDRSCKGYLIRHYALLVMHALDLLHIVFSCLLCPDYSAAPQATKALATLAKHCGCVDGVHVD